MVFTPSRQAGKLPTGREIDRPRRSNLDEVSLESLSLSVALSVEEVGLLQKHEAVIEKGLGTFVEVGEALLSIREQRLYRLAHITFEDYCRARWGMSRVHAHRLIEAAEVSLNLLPIGNILPANESQARPLAALPTPELQREVWQEVIDQAGEHRITAEWVKRAVERKIAVTEGRPEKPEVAPLPAGRYNLILADPPWRYDFSNTTGRSVEQHYHTMDLDSICAMKVRDLAADSAILFLWATMPKLPEALRVIEAWGFEYKSGAIWRKSGMGMGYYFRVDHELLLVATIGEPGVPLPENRVSSVIDAQKLGHSTKPEVFRELLERMYPAAKRIELFCRSTRQGWDAWGDEVPN
jgi:N6-adenosine-specific RNA methylase IME4